MVKDILYLVMMMQLIGKRKWSLYLFPDNTTLHSWGCQKDGNNTENGAFGLSGVLKVSTWNHVCVAHDLYYEYVYINGILKSKIKWDSNGTFTFDVDTLIINNYNNTNGSGNSTFKLNDFRIYDNCLSDKEIREISKGLCLHYSMNQIDGYIGGRNIIKNSSFNNAFNNWTSDNITYTITSNSIYKNQLNISTISGSKRIYQSLSNI